MYSQESLIFKNPRKLEVARLSIMNLLIAQRDLQLSWWLWQTGSTGNCLFLLTWPCFQHSRKIFQLFLLLGSWRQRSLPSQSQEWEVWGSSTFNPITISFTSFWVSVKLQARFAASEVFLFSTTEAMMWSRKLGRLALFFTPCQTQIHQVSLTEAAWKEHSQIYLTVVFIRRCSTYLIRFHKVKMSFIIGGGNLWSILNFPFLHICFM